MKILLGVDGSKYSEWAAGYLASLPFIMEPNIQVLHVLEWQTYNVPMMLDVSTRKKVINLSREKSLKAGKKILDNLQKKLSLRFKSVKSELVEGDIAEKLIQKAEKEDIDLVIVGCRGLGNITSFILGSVSQRIMTYAPCSVLIVKNKVKTVNHIFVAVDGSKYSDLSVDSIISWFSPKKLVVTVFNVTGYDNNAEKIPIAEKYASLLEHAGFKTNILYSRGNTAGMIVDAARQKKAGLLIIGSKGTVGLKRFLLGSVSRNVATHSEGSVLVLREEAI